MDVSIGVAACLLCAATLMPPQVGEAVPLTDDQVRAAMACGVDPSCKIAELAFGGRWLVVTHGNITTNVGTIAQLARQARERHAVLELRDVSSRLRVSSWVVTARGQPPTKVNYAAVQNFDRLLMFAKGANGKPEETPIQPEYMERVSRDWSSAGIPSTTRSVTAYFDPAAIPRGDFFIVTFGTSTLWHEVSHAGLAAAGLLPR